MQTLPAGALQVVQLAAPSAEKVRMLHANPIRPH